MLVVGRFKPVLGKKLWIAKCHSEKILSSMPGQKV